jgi:predicted ribosome quality control (RQC) complex YloA/Tae2 family protein
MIKASTEFTNFDVFAIVKELDLILRNGTILNIYEIEDLLLLKINTKFGKKNLIIKKDSRINLTEYDYPIPKYPSQYIISLRKLLKNRKIFKIYQHQFDRIVIFEISDSSTQPWKFIIELFNKGNFLLLDEDNIIKVAKKYKKFRDREILPNRKYSFPTSQGNNFLTLNKEEFKDLFKNSEVEIVRDISRKIHISGLYSEEICHRAKIDKKSVGKDLIDKEYEILYESLKKLRNQLLFGESNAYIAFDKNENQISVLPFEIEILNRNKKVEYDSFNEAVDKYFSKIDSEALKSPKDQKIEEQIESQQKILKNQKSYLKDLKDKKEKYYKVGELIYANLNSLENLITVISDARKKGYSCEIINEKLKTAKLENLNGTEFFEKIIPSTKQVLINIKNINIYLDLDKSIGENASKIYSKGKKADKKIEGTITAIKKTKDKIEKLERDKELIEAEIDFLIKKPKKKWYEKFRWFISSDDYLIIGGRDATSNEIIFKKHVDQNDLIFHTNFPGSPLVVVKNPDNREIPLSTINETSQFVASYSRAWKENWGVIDVFYISPDQISKTPPSGEYLKKGSFIISGKKHFIKNVKTELTIGLKFIEMESDSEDYKKILYPKIISGPKSAIKKETRYLLTIIPSRSSGFTKGKLAKEILSTFYKHLDKKLRIWIDILSINEILLYLPNGMSIVK